jgi:hypothetical protein
MGLPVVLKRLFRRHHDPEAQITLERSRTERREAAAEAQAAKAEAQAHAQAFPPIPPLP